MQYDNINILWVTTQTQLSSTPPPKKIFFPLAGEWPKLFRENNVEITRFDGGGGGVPLFLANFFSPPNSNGLLLSTFQARTNPPLTRALACCAGCTL